jgi:hypothetical protein
MNIEYYKLSDGFYKVSDIGENEIRITWVKEDWDDEDNISYSIRQWTVTLEQYKRNFTPDMICSRDRYESIINEIRILI